MTRLHRRPGLFRRQGGDFGNGEKGSISVARWRCRRGRRIPAGRIGEGSFKSEIVTPVLEGFQLLLRFLQDSSATFDLFNPLGLFIFWNLTEFLV
jgi:hypothetical protein